jgi:hypothetical protein
MRMQQVRRARDMMSHGRTDSIYLAGSFEVVEDMKPRVIRVDFPSLPLSAESRAAKLAENGMNLYLT